MGEKVSVLIINASASKQTGAKFIVEKYCSDCDFNSYEQVYLIGPKSLDIDNSKIIHIQKSTSRFSTYWFSIYGVSAYVKRYKATEILSFNNVNLISTNIRKITYFHQMLILSQKTLFPIVPTILRYTLKYLDNSDIYLVQSRYVKKKLEKIVHRHSKVKLSWPGYRAPSLKNTESNKRLLDAIRNDGFKYIALVPIVDTSKPHKNFEIISQNLEFLSRLKVAVLVTAEPLDEPSKKNIYYIGHQSKENLDALYYLSDFMIFPSLEETLGLPIYENAGCGGVTLVLDRPYLSGNPFIDSNPKNIIKFTDIDFTKKIESLLMLGVDEFKGNSGFPYSKGEWM